MPRLQSANNAQTTLSAGITAVVTTLTVVDASTFPATPFRITIDNEVMEVTAKSGTTFTVTRAQEGTVGAIHNAGATVENRFTAGTYGELMSRYVQTAAPTSPVAGDRWYDTTNNRDKYYNGTAWVDPLKYQ